MAIAHVDARSTKPKVSCASVQSGGQELRQTVNQWETEGLSAVAVLNPSQYQLSLIERPAVSDDELADALRWSIPAFGDESPEQLVLDYIELPDNSFRGRQPMLYVAAIARAEMNRIATLISEAGLLLSAIEIPELALGHLLAGKAADDTGAPLAWIHQQPEQQLINIYADHVLYFSRSLAINLASEDFQDLMEVKRSLDYYRHQMGGPACQQLWLSPLMVGEIPLLRVLEEDLGLQVSTVDLADWVSAEQSLTPEFQQQYLLAIAGGMRP